MLCLCHLLFINLGGINLVKCILLKGVLLWKILGRKRGTRWMKILHETRLLIRDRQIWRRTRIWGRFLLRVNHFSCVEVSGGKAVDITWFKSTMNSITAFSSDDSNVEKGSISPPHPVQTSQIIFSFSGFAKAPERSKLIIKHVTDLFFLGCLH